MTTASEIADSVLTAARVHPREGATWPASVPNGREPSNPNFGIYDGDAGIALQLLYMYEASEEKKYLDCAESVLRRMAADWRDTQIITPCFITGDLGLAYCLVEYARVTGDDRFKNTVLAIARRSYGSCLAGGRNEYLNGRAGVILALAHLFHRYPQDELFDEIRTLIKLICGQATLSRYGIYWDAEPGESGGITGISHGAAGICGTLNEVFRFFRLQPNDFLKEFLDGAWRFERAYYEADKASWAYRYIRPNSVAPGAISAAAEAAYKSGAENAFAHYRYPNTWCHGTTGGGLVRLLSGAREDDVCKREVQQCLFRAAAEQLVGNWTSLTLCHGAGGPACFIEEARLQGMLPATFTVPAFGMLVRQHFEINGALLSGTRPARAGDYSFFNGISGIGYALGFTEGCIRGNNIMFPVFRGREVCPPGYGFDDAYQSEVCESVCGGLPVMSVLAPGDMVTSWRKMFRALGHTSAKRFALGGHLPAQAAAELSEQRMMAFARIGFVANIKDEALIAAQYRTFRSEIKHPVPSYLMTNPSSCYFGVNDRKGILTYYRVDHAETIMIGRLCLLLLDRFRDGAYIADVTKSIQTEAACNLQEQIQAQIKELYQACLLVAPWHYPLVYENNEV